MRKRAIISSFEAAAGEIFSRSRSFGTAQAFLKKCDGAFLDVEQLAAQLGFFGFAGVEYVALGSGMPSFCATSRTASGKVMFSTFWTKLNTSP